ncbi:MAG TPA: CopD family protein [Gallionella sp.]|nr:CopD family protein [Gallionella sp.]
MALFKFIHLLAVLIWVGGMFFSYVVLRPAALEALDPPQRLCLWNAVFRRFFNWVWGAVGALLVSGFYLIYLYGGVAHVPRHVHIMLASGLAMMAIYGYVFFSCYVPLSLHVAKQRWKEAGEQMGRIRKLVAVNLALALLTVAAVAVGRAWA